MPRQVQKHMLVQCNASAMQVQCKCNANAYATATQCACYMTPVQHKHVPSTDAANTTPPLHKQLRGTAHGIRSDELTGRAHTGEYTGYIANKLLGNRKVQTHG